MRIAIIYLLAVVGAETVTTGCVFFVYFTQPEPVWGIVCHVVILVAVILHAARASRHPHRQLLLSLALVPLVRIISLSMPLANIPQIWWYPIIYAPLLVATIMVMRILGYKAEQVGLNFNRFRIQLAVMSTGFAFGVAEYFILRPEAMVAEFTWQGIVLPALILLVCTGFTEELMFRGVLQRSAVGAFGWWGVVYVSLLFAVLHMGFLSWLDVVFVFVVALFFGWAVKRTGSLVGVTLSHGITNILLFLVMPVFF